MLFTDSCWLRRQACNYSQFRKNRILAVGHRQFIDHHNIKIDALSTNMKYVLIKGVVHCVPRVGQNCA